MTTITTEGKSTPPDEWWRNAVIYQIYPRSFADGNGDGMGDLAGITEHLPFLRGLGVDAVWISPFYTSPQADAGYDVADYCDVDPLFGTLADADALLARAHELGLRVIVDLVPNHTSDQHPWFQRALAAAPGSPERDWYVFRAPDPADPDRLPNDWPSTFGGPAWSKTPDSQWYLHLFDSRQPDLNWANPQVREAFVGVLRFWLDRGVDGFRVDVAHGLVKADGLPDLGRELAELDELPTSAAPWWDQDGVHEIYRSWRAVLDEYPGERAMVAEAWVRPLDRLARYVRSDEFHQAFNFAFLDADWSAEALREGIEESYRSNDAVGAPATWVLSNHDVVRHASRLGFARRLPSQWLSPDEPAPDLELGLRRARAATTMLLALPGSAYLYQGEELGLPEVIDLPDEARQDPTFFRTQGERIGRDGCRVPLPWEKDAPNFGFGDGAAPWLPQPASFGPLAMDQQEGRPGSTLELYRSLLALRRARGLGDGSLAFVELGDGLLAFDVVSGPFSPVVGSGSAPAGSGSASSGSESAGSGSLTTRLVLNLGSAPWPIPAGAKVLVASDPSCTDAVGTDQAVWLELP